VFHAAGAASCGATDARGAGSRAAADVVEGEYQPSGSDWLAPHEGQDGKLAESVTPQCRHWIESR
jgi:hypothetical protein